MEMIPDEKTRTRWGYGQETAGRGALPKKGENEGAERNVKGQDNRMASRGRRPCLFDREPPRDHRMTNKRHRRMPAATVVWAAWTGTTREFGRGNIEGSDQQVKHGLPLEGIARKGQRGLHKTSERRCINNLTKSRGFTSGQKAQEDVNNTKI